jgi:short-subunit dehydrogenase involved in D-alanine esterification of teichoic acids
MDTLDQKVTIVTDGASGIDRATAHEFARRGARVVPRPGHCQMLLCQTFDSGTW